MKVLVTGANGMLGSALCPVMKKNKFDVLATDILCPENNKNIEFLDVRDFEAIKTYAAKEKPQYIFHLAAETNVDKCEIEIDHAFMTNTIGTENIALACQGLDIPMVYISTCGVFDGTKATPYNEFDRPNPISIYAKTKYEGERIVRNLLRKYFIFRAGWMIGGGIKDKKFVAKIAELIKTKDVVSVVNDKKGSPTFTRDFSEAALKVVKSGRYGLYHVTNSGAASRYDIACKIVEYLGRDNVTINPVRSASFPLPALRPDSEANENYKLKLIGITMRPWEEALKEYIQELS